MEVLGFVFLALVAVAVLIAVVLFVLSIPDLARYQRVRRM
jgi:hypothetical protein